MSDFVEELALRLRNHPDRVVSLMDLQDELNLPIERMSATIESLTKRKGFYDLGNGRTMFSTSANRVAFEVFKTEASKITFEEYEQFRDEPHILMRMSRDRDVASRMNPEKQMRDMIKEKERSRGNNVR